MGTDFKRWGLPEPRCTRCDKPVGNMNREEQDEHEKECMKQEKLF